MIFIFLWVIVLFANFYTQAKFTNFHAFVLTTTSTFISIHTLMWSQVHRITLFFRFSKVVWSIHFFNRKMNISVATYCQRRSKSGHFVFVTVWNRIKFKMKRYYLHFITYILYFFLVNNCVLTTCDVLRKLKQCITYSNVFFYGSHISNRFDKLSSFLKPKPYCVIWWRKKW